jgi:hypothetical protein
MMIVGVAVATIMVMAGHGVADGRAADPAHDRLDRTADHRSADRARDPSGHRAGLISERRRRRSAEQRRGRAKHPIESSQPPLGLSGSADVFGELRFNAP